MHLRAALAAINPFTSMAGMVVMSILLVATIFLTILDLPWIAFLAGILCAASIGLVSRLVYAETTLADVRESVRYLDIELPIMIVYVSADGTVRYHNPAFRSWLRLREASVNGRHLRDAVGLTIFAQLKAGLDAALAGRPRRETRIHEGLGTPYARIFTQYLPHLGERGVVVGAFILQTDVTGEESSPATARAAAPAPAEPAPADPAARAQAPDGAEPERRMFVQTMTEELTGWRDAGDRLRAALDNNEFCLYVQEITSLSEPAGGGPFLEMLLRLREEEDGLMPPGAFIPIAEEYGLMPDLDRWVVRNVLAWARANPARLAGTYSINLSAATIAAEGFVEYVAAQARREGGPGPTLCFEILTEDALADRDGAARLVAALAEVGCRTMLCGFGQNATDYGLLKSMPVDYIKIDTGIVLGLNRNAVDLIKLKAICRVARTTNRRTVAEFVEDDATLEKLRAHGVDFAQGYGIARPRPIDDRG